MTQEEARIFLSDRKVFVKNKSKEIQLKLFEIGFRWIGSSSKEFKNLNCPFLYLYKDMTLSAGYYANIFYNHKFEEISAENILNIKVEHFPKTWKEFCENNPIKIGEATLNSDTSTIVSLYTNHTRRSDSDRCCLPSTSAAKAHRALMQLHQLRDCYRGNVDPYECQYAIVRGLSGLIVVKDITAFLSFPTKKIADEFLNNFSDLILQAGDLI